MDSHWLSVCKEKCSICKRGIANYYCHDANCRHFNKNVLYCDECMEEGTHMHAIQKEITDIFQEYSDELTNLRVMHREAEEKMKVKMGGSFEAIEYLDKLMAQKC